MMISAKCPAEIPTTENTNVKFFRDYENTTTGVSKTAKQMIMFYMQRTYLPYSNQVKFALQIMRDIRYSIIDISYFVENITFLSSF